MSIINLTPHTINILREKDGKYHEVAKVIPSGQVAHLEVTRKVSAAPITGAARVTFFRSTFGNPIGLPDRKENTIYIVSSLFRSGCDREDLWAPGKLIRDEEGRPIGCLGLSR